MSSFLSKVLSYWLSPLSEADPGAIATCNMKLFARIVLSCKIRIWLLDVARLVNWPLLYGFNVLFLPLGKTFVLKSVIFIAGSN